MPQRLCLTRHCLGIDTRIELAISSLSSSGLWGLFCAAGLEGAQPTEVKAQGPMHGGREADAVLAAVVENLEGMGYRVSDSPPIWSLHVQAELRHQRRLRGSGQTVSAHQPH